MTNLNALQIASTDLLTIEIDDSVVAAHSLMREKNVRHLVVSGGNQAIGVVSERDVMKALRLEIKDFYSVRVREESFDPSIKVRDVMSWPIVSVDENIALSEVVDKILEQKISSLLVTRDKAAVGIVTTDDLLTILRHYLADEQKSFWGDLVTNVYSVPLRTVMEVLSNTGI